MPPGALSDRSYGRVRVLEAPGRPMLVIGRSFYEETVKLTAGEEETEEEETA